MKSSRYGPGNHKFEKYKVSKLPLHMFNREDYKSAGCGATALGLLTGVNPVKIRGKREHFSDRFMVDFLRKHGFRVMEINKANLTNRKEWSFSLDDRNVILYSSLMRKKEASWVILNGNYMYHNFEIMSATYLTFLNNPWETGYVLYKKGWK